MRRMTPGLAAFCLALVVGVQSQQINAQEKDKPRKAGSDAKIAAEEKTGIAIGEKAPQFKLPDQAGNERSLGEMLHEGTVAVVFHRSASW
ncbi:MAG: hypothetical protein O2856_00965 [Planctomycetota bacterium]|nr:hypothetical protein [Planctomycetota bacterium]